LVIAAAAGTAMLVAARAEAIAGSDPYCIQVSDRLSDYHAADAWLDLSVLTMWAHRTGPLFMQHHAILMVGDAAQPRLYHWSYRSLGFVPGVINGTIPGRGPALTCVPAKDFARSRLALLPTSSGSIYVRFPQRETYRIPPIWQPKWEGGASPNLRLAATAPEIQPLQRRWRDLAPAERDSNWIFIEWNPDWMLSLMKAPVAAPGDTAEQSTAYGLAKTATVTHGKDGKTYRGQYYIAYARDAAPGVNTTLISCGMPSEAFPKSCQHRFIHKGRHFYFRHHPDDVTNWRDIQQRILQLMASFEVQDGKGS
jgi:hypothetical protein